MLLGLASKNRFVWGWILELLRVFTLAVDGHKDQSGTQNRAERILQVCSKYSVNSFPLLGLWREWKVVAYTVHGYRAWLSGNAGGYPSLLTLCPGMFKSTQSPTTAVLCYRLPVYTNLNCNTRTHFNTRGHRCPHVCTSGLSPNVQDVRQWQISFNCTSW